MTQDLKTDLNINKLYKIYIFAIIVNLFPFASLLIFIVDQLTFHNTEMIFFVIFLISLLPCGLLGVILSLIGLKKSIMKKNRTNKYVGIIGIIWGLMAICGGILGIMLLFVVLMS